MDAPDPDFTHDAEIARLAQLDAGAQGDVDVTLLEANLRLTPLERIEACQQAVEQVAQLQQAMKAARHA